MADSNPTVIKIAEPKLPDLTTTQSKTLTAIILGLKKQVEEANADGHFSQAEIWSLMTATINAVELTYKNVKGTDKRSIVEYAVKTTINQLVEQKVIDGTLAIFLNMLPLGTMIDHTVAMMGGAKVYIRTWMGKFKFYEWITDLFDGDDDDNKNDDALKTKVQENVLDKVSVVDITGLKKN